MSPEKPAARDEGPRLIPLGPIKDSGLARIEHYLALADKALGFSMPRTPGAPPEVLDDPGSPEGAPEPVLKKGVVSPPAPPVEEVLAKTRLIPPLPPKLQLPKPPRSPRPPRPPKAPAFPKPRKLSLPKPPRRRHRGG